MKATTDIRLHVPAFEELAYRQKLLSDAATMRYNIGYDIPNANYCRETGCIDFPPESWKDWYGYFIGQEPRRYYAYIVADGAFVGEVNVHINAQTGWYDMGVVVEAAHRGKGYGLPALKLLLKQAFEVLEAQAVHNDFEETRLAGMRIHLAAGFQEHKRENGIIDLLITKERYEEMKGKWVLTSN